MALQPQQPTPDPVRPEQEAIPDDELDFCEWVEFDRITEQLLRPHQNNILSSRLMTWSFTLAHLRWLDLHWGLMEWSE